MNFDKEFNALDILPSEMEALASGLDISRNALSTIAVTDCGKDEIKAALADFEKLSKEKQHTFSSAIKDLFNPVKAVVYQQSTGEEEIVHSVFAWGPKQDDSVAVLMQRPGIFSLSNRDIADIKTIIERALVVDDKLLWTRILVKLSPFTAIVLLAVMDFFRLCRYQSLLTHTAPIENFIISQIQDLMRNAGEEDFRWPLNFIEKIFPADITTEATEEKLSAAMQELENAGFILSTPPEKGERGPTIYMLTDVGEVVSRAAVNNISKVGITLSSPRPDKQVGYETLLFLRDANYLFLFDITGEVGVVTTLDAKSFDKVMEDIFKPPEAKAKDILSEMEPVAAVTKDAPEAVEQQQTQMRCSQCQEPIASGVQFCAKCGAPTAAPAGKKFCPGCGQPINIDAKFCKNCGVSL